MLEDLTRQDIEAAAAWAAAENEEALFAFSGIQPAPLRWALVIEGKLYPLRPLVAAALRLKFGAETPVIEVTTKAAKATLERLGFTPYDAWGEGGSIRTG
ncbi:MAG: hypothetical protein WDZ84_08775 [Rhodovibrionaceae bacterium]